jgi:hypothetical protein
MSVKISPVNHYQDQWYMDRVRQDSKRQQDYTKVVEKRNFDRIIAERVARNLRLDLDKGRKIDVNC